MLLSGDLKQDPNPIARTAAAIGFRPEPEDEEEDDDPLPVEKPEEPELSEASQLLRFRVPDPDDRGLRIRAIVRGFWTIAKLQEENDRPTVYLIYRGAQLSGAG